MYVLGYYYYVLGYYYYVLGYYYYVWGYYSYIFGYYSYVLAYYSCLLGYYSCLLGYYSCRLGYYSYVSGTSLNVKEKNLIPPLPGATMGWYIAYMVGYKSCHLRLDLSSETSLLYLMLVFCI